MIDSWNAAGDFERVVDTLEPVRLWRKGAPAPEGWTAGWRFWERAPAAGSSPLPPIESDIVWQLPDAPGAMPPAPGDRVLDAAGGDWTLTSVERLRGRTRFRCQGTTTDAPPA